MCVRELHCSARREEGGGRTKRTIIPPITAMSAMDTAMKAIMPLRNILDLAWMWGREERGSGKEGERTERGGRKGARAGSGSGGFPFSQ